MAGLNFPSPLDYIISRAVGPELGGAIGLVFWLSYSASGEERIILDTVLCIMAEIFA